MCKDFFNSLRLVGWLFWVGWLVVYGMANSKDPDQTVSRSGFGWLVDFGFNDPLRQYFSLYRVVSQREAERAEKG